MEVPLKAATVWAAAYGTMSPGRIGLVSESVAPCVARPATCVFRPTGALAAWESAAAGGPADQAVQAGGLGVGQQLPAGFGVAVQVGTLGQQDVEHVVVRTGRTGSVGRPETGDRIARYRRGESAEEAGGLAGPP